MDPGAIPDESDLCVSCGMCCDGTYLSWAPVLPDDDVTGLQSVDHPVLHSPARGSYFALPCPALVDKCCTVYGHRPDICPTYRCVLLDKFGRGEVEADRAIGLIRATLEVRDRVRAALDERLGVDTSRPLFELYAGLQAGYDESPDPAAARQADADLLVDIGLLRRLLNRHFDKNDPVAQPVEMAVKPRR